MSVTALFRWLYQSFWLWVYFCVTQITNGKDKSVRYHVSDYQRHDTSRYTQSHMIIAAAILLRFCDIRNQPILHNTGIYIYTYIHIQYKDANQQPPQPYKYKITSTHLNSVVLRVYLPSQKVEPYMWRSSEQKSWDGPWEWCMAPKHIGP